MKKENHPEAKKKDLEFLKYLEEEDQMHDDHGPVILGPREKKPKIPEETDKPERQ